MIKMYTQPNCRYCDIAKNYLLEQGETFQEIDILADQLERAYVVDAGFQTTPVLEIDGELVDGARIENIQNALYGDVFEEEFDAEEES